MIVASKEISKGKNLSDNLPKFGKGLLNVYNNYSMIRLSMNLYTMTEILSEDDKDERLANIKEQIINVIEKNVLNVCDGDGLEDIVSLRNEIIGIMKGLTSLADIFNIYEYVLNRIEYNFKDSSHIEAVSDEEFANRIVAYILSDKDNVVMNTRITEIVGQMPIRMTKNKFFELLHTGMMVYNGSEKQSVIDYLYMLKSSSMLDIDENALELNCDIKDIFYSFKNLDYKELNEEKYNEMHDKLMFTTDFIEKNINKYMIIAEVINDIYVIAMSNSVDLERPLEYASCIEIISKITGKLKGEEIEEDIEQYYYNLEGRQEDYYRDFSQAESTLMIIDSMYKDNVSDLGLMRLYKNIEMISKLESGSIFIEFDVEMVDGIAEQDYIEEKYNELRSELEVLFKDNQRVVNRAIMAQILSALPVFFGSMDEIKNYISGSISQCTDNAEKMACFEIMQKLVEE